MFSNGRSPASTAIGKRRRQSGARGVGPCSDRPDLANPWPSTCPSRDRLECSSGRNTCSNIGGTGLSSLEITSCCADSKRSGVAAPTVEQSVDLPPTNNTYSVAPTTESPTLIGSTSASPGEAPVEAAIANIAPVVEEPVKKPAAQGFFSCRFTSYCAMTANKAGVAAQPVKPPLAVPTASDGDVGAPTVESPTFIGPTSQPLAKHLPK